MGYIIRELRDNKTRTFKVQFQSDKGGTRKVRDIPPKELFRYGFRDDMTLEEARARKDQLNAQGHLKRIEEIRHDHAQKIEKAELTFDAFFGRVNLSKF